MPLCLAPPPVGGIAFRTGEYCVALETVPEQSGRYSLARFIQILKSLFEVTI
jgi:hypothetical protein